MKFTPDDIDTRNAKATNNNYGTKPHTRSTAALNVTSVMQKAVALFEKHSGLDVAELRKGNFPDGCISWKGAIGTNGYGVQIISLTETERSMAEALCKMQFRQNGCATVSAHRLALYVMSGEAKAGGATSHQCNNSLCVNPAHICMGTQRENLKDASDMGRLKGLHRNPRKKVDTLHLADRILPILTGQKSIRSVAKEHGMSHGHVSWLVSGKNRPEVLKMARQMLSGI